MPEDPENWWESDAGESKESALEAPETIAIRGYRREGDHWVQKSKGEGDVTSEHWVQKSKGEGDVTSEADSAERSDYDKQKIAATALFLLSFIFGDWWWDGSHGPGGLINSIESITYMPGSLTGSYEFWTSQQGFNPLDAILITISWALWDISTLVFTLGFALCWMGWPHVDAFGPGGEEWIGNGRTSYKFLLYFSVALISMDILSYTVWEGLLGVIFWPIDFIEWHFWQLVAILAAMGLNPDFDFVGRLTSQSAKE